MRSVVAAIVVVVGLAAGGCGPGGGAAVEQPAPAVRERATGKMPKVVREGGAVRVALGYPRYEVSGEYTYYAVFAVADDELLRSLEEHLAATAATEVPYYDVEVSVVQIGRDRWRVDEWHVNARR
jgi:hypothetical protein